MPPLINDRFDPSFPIFTPARDPLLDERPSWWWTCGSAPSAPLISERLPNLASCSREQTLRYFSNGWTLNELLFSALQGEEAFRRPPTHGLRHPLIFYYGHTASLFANKLLIAGLINAPINERFERVFEVGVDEMSWDDMSKNEMPWPSVREVSDYRRQVFIAVEAAIRAHPDLADGHAPIDQRSPLWGLFMAMEHDRIHLETSSVLIRETPLNYLRPPQLWPRSGLAPSAPASRALAPGFEPVFASVPGTQARLGKPLNYPSYGWDNEYGSRSARLAPFEVSRHLITNAQFLRFVQDGGYSADRHWSAEGWRWRAFKNTKHPQFWVPHGPSGLHRYAIRTLFELVDWAPDLPVCVNQHEARAYLAWRAQLDGRPYRLPTEAEHALLRRGAHFNPERFEDLPLTCGSDELAASQMANSALALGSETSVLWARPGPFGVSDIAGNLWDWCEDDFHPLEGFEPHPLYEDFSSPCFDGRHAMMLGGSFISTGSEASAFARFHFRRHFHQHAGFRLVAPSEARSGAVRIFQEALKYDRKSVLDQYLLFHHGESALALPSGMRDAGIGGFPQRVAARLAQTAARLGCGFESALDVGCAVGGGSFELARSYRSTLAVDLSEPFIDAAKALSRGEALPYLVAIEGDLSAERLARAPLSQTRGALAFRVADACDLPTEWEGFDAVLASNLLCRLPNPKAFLARMSGNGALVRPGGLVAFASPLSWMEQFTPKSAWLGGFIEKGCERWSFDGLREALGPEFELVEREDAAFMIREHQRKFEYVVSDLTIWRRKASL